MIDKYDLSVNISQSFNNMYVKQRSPPPPDQFLSPTFSHCPIKAPCDISRCKVKTNLQKSKFGLLWFKVTFSNITVQLNLYF